MPRAEQTNNPDPRELVAVTKMLSCPILAAKSARRLTSGVRHRNRLQVLVGFITKHGKEPTTGEAPVQRAAQHFPQTEDCAQRQDVVLQIGFQYAAKSGCLKSSGNDLQCKRRYSFSRTAISEVKLKFLTADSSRTTHPRKSTQKGSRSSISGLSQPGARLLSIYSHFFLEHAEACPLTCPKGGKRRHV